MTSVCCNKVYYSPYPVQADASQQLKTGQMHNKLSKSYVCCLSQLLQVPCGFARALSLHHFCNATVILQSLLTTVA